MIKFSIITVTFNAGSVVERTLDSVNDQTWPCIEHIIIDGASHDDTISKVLEYKKKFERIVRSRTVEVISEPDKGLYDAMNKGLRMATGHYVCFLNAGDALHSYDTIELLERNARQSMDEDDDYRQPAVLYGETAIIDNDGLYLRPRRLKAPEVLTWKSFRDGMLVCHQAFYVRADIAKSTEYDLRYRHSADVDWCIRVMKKAEKMNLPLVNVHEKVADYLREGDSTVHHRASLMERFDIMRRHYGLAVTLAKHAWFVVRAIIKK